MGKYSEAFVAFDVAKKKHAVAIAEGGRAGEVRFLGDVENSWLPIERTIKRLASRYDRLHVCFEAGPTGYGLYRQIQALGHDCMVVAPALIPKRAGERIKTNRRDAVTLARLLDAKRAFQTLDWTHGGTELLDELLRHPNGLRRLNVALVEVRKSGLSSQVADVSVCGAVAPYNTLLGGKLIALLMTASEVRDAYRERYSEQVSLISSQMAGRPVYRPAELKVLTTTSLYGNGSSQYNRLRLRSVDYPELDQDVEWRELARQTAGYGTVHLAATTVRVLREVSERMYRARRINNRFGEGASPRLRQIREALDILGIESSSVLNHATPRIFYGCELHPRAHEELLGLYPITENEGISASVIARLWRQRWLVNRIRSEDVLAKVAAVNSATLATFFSGAAPAEDDGQVKFEFMQEEGA